MNVTLTYNVMLNSCAHQLRYALQSLLVSKTESLKCASLMRTCLIRYYSDSHIKSTTIIKSAFPDIPIPPLTIDQFVFENLGKWPDHIAMTCGITGQQYSYSKLRNRCKRFACSLRKRGLKPGDVLAIMLPNSIEYPVILLGALEAGLIVSTINPAYTHHEIAHQLSVCDASILVTIPNNLSKIEAAKCAMEKEHSRACSLTHVVIVAGNEAVANGIWKYEEMVADDASTFDIKSERSSGDVALLPFSSGTTGLSKGVEITHFNAVSNMLQMSTPELSYTSPTCGETQDVLPAVLPFFHCYGLMVILLKSLSHGSNIIPLPSFEPRSFLSLIKDRKSTALYVVPPIAIFLGNNAKVTADTLASLKYIVNGAGPLAATDGQKIVEKIKFGNAKFIQAYGLTETSPCVLMSKVDAHYLDSVGIPPPNTLLKLQKADGNFVTESGETGEILIKGPQVMKGYHKNEKATADVIDEEGYFHTGDVAFYDQNGNFHIVERLKELIKVKGFQVPPAELEAILRSHPAVAEAGVIGIVNEKQEEKPSAFVVLKDGFSTLSERELQTFVNEKVAPYKRLTGGIRFIKSLPKSSTGKILRRLLREM